MRTPKWLRRTLDMPGAVSFARLEPAVDVTLRAASELRAVDDATLAVRAATVSDATPRAEVLAITVEAARRALSTEPFRAQLLGATAMLDGYCIEMDTGEGKTLAGALAAASFALMGRTVHVISVNDYLAARDADWMGPMYDLLGVSVASVTQQDVPDERRTAYRAQVTYVSVSEVGYDVLRDRVSLAPAERVSPVADVAIVDEADAVMIDEAMVPLVLAGTSPAADRDASDAARLVEDLADGDHFIVDQDGATVSFTDAGLDELESRLGGINLYDPEHIPLLTGLSLALHARVLLQRDVDYIVENGRIRLVNVSRGRIAHSQRWPDGMHAAVEAKESVIQSGSGVILDQVTVQDLLLGYRTLTGMSGTVVAVAGELTEFYSLRSGRVERRLPQARVDEPDVILATADEVLAAVKSEVARRHRTGQPILVGTQSIAESERIAETLESDGLIVRVLNAKNDEDEAHTIARAGELGAITISTQMSGRGTDIVLGGTAGADHDAIATRGGLAVIQVGLYPSRRLDAQLRGRAGRQGDPGASVRICSITDELVLNTATRSIRSQVHHPERVSAPRRDYIVKTAQEISEGIRADQHRATWGYNRAIAKQRATTLAEREVIETSDDEMLERLSLSRQTLSVKDVAGIREVTLTCLDEQWTEHLASLQSLRDGIHLRALGGQNPLDEFHRLALAEFDGFFDRAYEIARGMLVIEDTLGVQAAADLARSRRPSATWTYMVTDNPLGDAMSRATETLRSKWLDAIGPR